MKSTDIALILLICFVMFFSCGLGYYFFIFKPNEERIEQNEERNKEIQIERKLNDCLRNADENYKQNWNATCKANRLGADCSLPIESANYVESIYRAEKDDCRK